MVLSQKNGHFIVFEGLDGSGTTTQIKLLSRYLSSLDIVTHLTREPSDRPIGLLIRQALQKHFVLPSGKRLTPETIALLFAADRADHLAAEIEPRVARGEWVLSDRYLPSSLAYQGAECELSWVKSINKVARKADLTLFLDVSVATCVERIQHRSAEIEIFEHHDRLVLIKEKFEETLLAEKKKDIIRIDGSLSVEKVHQNIVDIIRQFF